MPFSDEEGKGWIEDVKFVGFLDEFIFHPGKLCLPVEGVKIEEFVLFFSNLVLEV